MSNLICQECGVDMNKKIEVERIIETDKTTKKKKVMRRNIGKVKNPKEGKKIMFCKECNRVGKEDWR